MAALENLTIMFTDIVGFSDLVAKLPRLESEKLLEKHDRILMKIIRRFGGKTIKSIGDSFLVIFRSPTDAVLCGMAMHDALWDANQQANTRHPIVIRVALNTGEVRLTRSDVFGDAVNIASRVEQITPANAVYLTEAVYLSMSKAEMHLERIDSFRFKGVSDEVNVYQASYKPLEDKTEQHLITDEKNYPYGGAHIHHRANKNLLFMIGIASTVLIACLTIIAITWWATTNYSTHMVQVKIPVEYRTPASLPSTKTDIDILSDEFIVTSQLKEKAAPFLAAKDYIGLDNLVADHASQYIDNAYLQLLSAHADTYFKRYSSAIKNYNNALNSTPSFASDDLTAKNLISLLEPERIATNQLIAANLNAVLIRKLATRTGEKGLPGRYDAFHLLMDSGNARSIDLVGLNIWDLRELNQCQLKKIAVTELKRLKDKRALGALEEAINVGIMGRIKYFCLRKEAKEAIAIIRGS